MPNGLDIKVTSTTAQDDRVVAEVESRGCFRRWKVYNQRLVLVIRVRDNKILRIRKYLDTQHAVALLVTL
ncbi:nuclear transport factor 2 family protein [Streptomyces sp. NPDC051913]|uniref:nuclear transport factor 2 family protein n=1 Tax=Streptomyces sp. NPDC051913 TaxID=3365676 RepID=UPI0037CE3FAD